nr:hypothetical protein [Kribbella shirazensis]
MITDSADGLGQMVARELATQGHEVVLHARNEQRAADARQAIPDAAWSTCSRSTRWRRTC